jgi:hypothetical protein
MTQTKAELLQTRHQGDIRLGDADSTHYVGFKAPTTVGTSLVWTLPAADGTANYLLKTDGSGNLGWVADSTTDSTKMPLTGGIFTGDVTFDGATAGRDIVFDRSDNALEFADNAKATFGADADLQIFHDPSNGSYIKDAGGGDLVLQGSGIIRLQGSTASETLANFSENGAVELYHDNVKKIQTYSNGINVSGRIQFTDVGLTDVIEVPDGKKITVGSGGDCSFYHDGSDSYISDQGTGNLNILSSKAQILNAAGNEAMAKFTADGAVELFHDNSSRLTTTAAGVEIGGNLSTASASNFIINAGGASGTAANFLARCGSENAIVATANGSVDLYHNNVKKFETQASGIDVTGSVGCDKIVIDGPYQQVAEALGALDVNCGNGNYFTKTINANSTFTFSNVPGSGTSFAFTLELTHTSGTVTWPSSVKWNADTAPTLTTGKTHLFMFVTDDGGTRWRGSALVDYVN